MKWIGLFHPWISSLSQKHAKWLTTKFKIFAVLRKSGFEILFENVWFTAVGLSMISRYNSPNNIVLECLIKDEFFSLCIKLILHDSMLFMSVRPKEFEYSPKIHIFYIYRINIYNIYAKLNYNGHSLFWRRTHFCNHIYVQKRLYLVILFQ